MLVSSTEGARDLKEVCKFGYDGQAKGREWASRPTSTPNPRTNEQTNKQRIKYDFIKIFVPLCG